MSSEVSIPDRVALAVRPQTEYDLEDKEFLTGLSPIVADVKPQGQAKIALAGEDYTEIIGVVISFARERTWWPKQKGGGLMGGRPHCFSRDSITPDPTSENKQCTVACVHCVRSRFSTDGDGTRVNPECRLSYRLGFISLVPALATPVLLFLPQICHRPFDEFRNNVVARRGSPARVIVKITARADKSPNKFDVTTLDFSVIRELVEVERGYVKEAREILALMSTRESASDGPTAPIEPDDSTEDFLPPERKV